jgi:hypothetical protein
MLLLCRGLLLLQLMPAATAVLDAVLMVLLLCDRKPDSLKERYAAFAGDTGCGTASRGDSRPAGF